MYVYCIYICDDIYSLCYLYADLTPPLFCEVTAPRQESEQSY